MNISPELQVAILSLCQGLIWPVFVGIVLVASRTNVVAMLRSISRRIEQGDPIQAGPISIGKSENKLTRLNELDEFSDASKRISKQNSSLAGEQALDLSDVIYLIHTTTASSRDVDGEERWGIRVVVDADSEEILDKIEKVVYHLHPTFRDPDREIKNRKNNFELRTRAWGEFNLIADVYLKGYKKPLTINRYLNYPSS